MPGHLWPRSAPGTQNAAPPQDMSSTLFARGTNGQVGVRARTEKMSADINEHTLAIRALTEELGRWKLNVAEMSKEIVSLKLRQQELEKGLGSPPT